MSNEVQFKGFPQSLPCEFGGEMRPRFWFPHAHSAPSRPYVIYWSDLWSFGRLHFFPTDEELARFYAAAGYHQYLAGSNNASRPKRRSLLRRLIESLVYRVARNASVSPDTDATAIQDYLGRPSDICDIGCGSGVMLEALANLGHRVVGVEPNEDARSLGIQRQIEIVEGSGEDVSRVSTRRFDLVSMVQSLEHARDPLAAVRNCAGLLKPGGVLWIEVPNHQSVGFALRGPVWFHTDAGRHTHFFSRSSLEVAVRQAGLEFIEARYSGYMRQFFWLDAEMDVWDQLYLGAAADRGTSIPHRPSVWSLLRLLTQTWLAAPGIRCDSVSVLARKPMQS